MPSGHCRPGTTDHAKTAQNVRTLSAADVQLDELDIGAAVAVLTGQPAAGCATIAEGGHTPATHPETGGNAQ